ncbi:MAG: hypothetical protein LBU64_11440 [Planctomycetota bacterium]|jgi:hypothetical protein|nr:hypothetical protein [Planctomycetota bacterium]
MLTVSKPTQFNPDGMAVRGQCNHDSPGWQLIWFTVREEPTPIWEGSYKTCRRLQTGCREAGNMEEARRMLRHILDSPSQAINNQPTDAYPAPTDLIRELDPSEFPLRQKKKKRKSPRE